MRREPFIPGWIREQGFTAVQLAVYVYITSRGDCWTSRAEIARTLQITRNTVASAIEKLAAHGWVKVTGNGPRGTKKIRATVDGRPVQKTPMGPAQKTPPRPGRPAQKTPPTCSKDSTSPAQNVPSKVLPESSPIKFPQTTPAMSTNKQPYPLDENPRSEDLLREPTIREKWEARDRAAAEARKGSRVPTMEEVMAAFESGDARSGLFMAARRMRP